MREDGRAGRQGRVFEGGVWCCGGGTSEAPEIVDPCDGADEVAVGHVGEGGEVGLRAGGGGDAAAGADPLAGTFGLDFGGIACRRGSCG